VSDLVPICKDALTPAEYQKLADVPPESEWLGNITNEKTQRAYKIDVLEFVVFTGLHGPAALSSLFDYLCERNAVAGNPVDGVKRPASNNNEGSTPALGDAQARRLLEALPRTR
jgi:integrase/recombinase XerD